MARRVRRERGFAMLAFISLMAMLAAWWIATTLNRSSAELINERERRTQESLRKAKAALIAYAASEQWQTYRGATKFQPGALPCPDRDFDGDSDGVCGSALLRIGRLPWKTIGSDDLRDASGEHLWYVLSSSFRKLDGTTVINSDTAGQLRVTDTTPASNVVAIDVVAIVFAPGAPLAGQNRDPAGAFLNDPASYLEGFGAGYDTFATSASAQPTDTFNDRLTIVTQEDIMIAVEPVVAALIERDVKPLMASYYADWGVYPFPTPFSLAANPVGPGIHTDCPGAPPPCRAQSDYLGDNTLGNADMAAGLLPITASGNPWTAGSISATTLLGAPYPLFVAFCGDIGTGYACVVFDAAFGAIPTGTTFRLQAEFANPGKAWAKKPALAEVTVQVNGAATTFAPQSLTGSMNADGSTGTMIYQGTYTGAPCLACWVWITIPGITPTLASATQSTSAAYWFVANQWYRHTYYAVSKGFLLGGGGNCNTVGASPLCLTVTKPSGTTNNNRVVLMLAGRTLTGTLRPNPALAEYYEGQNAGANTLVFEHRAGAERRLVPPTTATYAINDRVVVVAP